MKTWSLPPALLFLAACSGGGGGGEAPVNEPVLFAPRPADPAAMDGEKELRLALEHRPDSLNPLFAGTAEASAVSGLIHDCLFGAGPAMELLPNEAMVAAVAEGDGGRLATVRLREGLRWQDGQPLTAADVAFSFALLGDERVPVRRLRASPQVAALEALDPLTFQMRFHAPSPVNRWELFFPLLPRHLWAEVRREDPTLRRAEAARALELRQVGCGPYRLAAWRPDEEIVLERWDAYPGPRPPFRRIHWQVVPDRNAALLLFRGGRLDLLRLPTPGDFLALRQAPELLGGGRLARGDTWTWQFVAWNLKGRNPLPLDRRVRRALAMTLDREGLARELLGGLVTPSTGPFHPDSWAADPAVRPLPFDPAGAGRLLDEAGWTRNERGWRRGRAFAADREGADPVWTAGPGPGAAPREAPAAFRLLLPAGASSTHALARRWRDSLAAAGVEMGLESAEAALFQERLRAGDFDALMMAWGPGVDPSTSADLFTAGGEKNLGGYCNPEADRLYAAGLAESDPQRRREIYRRLHRLLAEDQPYLFLWFLPELLLAAPSLRGLAFGPRGVMGHMPGILGWWCPAREAP